MLLHIGKDYCAIKNNVLVLYLKKYAQKPMLPIIGKSPRRVIDLYHDIFQKGLLELTWTYTKLYPPTPVEPTSSSDIRSPLSST